MADIGIVTNLLAPYRLPIFEYLSNFHAVTVYFTDDDVGKRKWNTSLEDTGFAHHFLPYVSIGPFRINYSLPTLLRENDHDIIIVADHPSTVIGRMLAMIIGKLGNSQFVVWSEGIDTNWNRSDDELQLAKRLYEWIRSLIYKRSDACVAYSAKAAEFLTRRGVSDSKIESGVQVLPKDILREPPSENSYEDHTFVLSLGYLEERKGIDALIESLDLTETQAELFIAGEGPERNYLEDIADASTTFLGYVDEEKKAALFEAAELFVLPSRHDPWGLVVNEALHYGTPVVTTSQTGAAAIVERTDAGVVVDDPEPDQIATAIDEVFNNYDAFVERATGSRTVVSDVELGAKPFLKVVEDLQSE
jgi:glycosyltransferase involved in cell wall biosynthesis